MKKFCIRFYENKRIPVKQNKKHVIIFVQGYKGSYCDLDYLKNHLYAVNPNLEFYALYDITDERDNLHKESLKLNCEIACEEIRNFLVEDL